MKFTRVFATRWLSEVYAPGGVAGEYYVLSEGVGVFAGALCIVGYVLLIDNKPTRCWFNP